MGGYIQREFIDKLMDVVRIEEVIKDFVESLNKAGANYKGLSPFTKERTPSFVVNPVKEIWKDFSSGRGGNVISFLIEHKGFSYVEAIEYLAGKYSMPVEYDNPEVAAKKAEELKLKEELRPLLNKANALYKKAFKDLPAEHPAKQEVYGHRQYTDDVVLEWQIGYAPGNLLYDSFYNAGRLTEARKLGLIREDDTKDFFYDRVMYPIKDKNGLLVGFGARDLSGKEKSPKWINPKESELYKKDKVWFGMDKALQAIRKADEAYIVEGYNDVIGFHTYGVINTVASCGTSITVNQIKELRRYCSKVTLVMDPDAAGKRAVLKILPEFITQNFRTSVIELDADPDDYVRAHKEELTEGENLLLPGILQGLKTDGFKILIDKFLKEDFLEQEIALKEAEKKLEELLEASKQEAQKLKTEKTDAEEAYTNAKSVLREIELRDGRKAETFKDQALIVAEMQKNAKLAIQKQKSFTKTNDVTAQELTVKELQRQYDDAFLNGVINRMAGAKVLLKLIHNLEDRTLYLIYKEWIEKESHVSTGFVKTWLQEFDKETSPATPATPVNYDDYEYVLPPEVTVKFEEVEEDIEKYGMFMSDNRIYMINVDAFADKYYFTCVSNFIIEILQHMNDEKFPMKLIRIKNIFGKEKVFDTLSDNINSPQKFDTMVTDHGNYRFDGNRKQLLTLRAYLMDKMGVGRKIDVLGWQADGKFWCWNNLAVLEDGTEMPIDENGMLVINNVHYYVPSANVIYASNPYKFDAQKRFRVITSKYSIALFMQEVYAVHREHAISGLLFAIASLFRDVVVEKLNKFPILFLYGPGGTGKDELAEIVQSFVGVAQTAINLEAGLSTGKASIRELAQFTNGISQLSEYKRGNSEVDGMLKQIWDCRGYKRGNIESHIGVDSIPVESSVILTGNDFPEPEALIQRLIWNEMVKNQFSSSQIVRFDGLKDIMGCGVSGFGNELLKHRKLFTEKFEKTQRNWKAIIKERFPEATVRMGFNLSILGAAYEIFKDIVVFPFSQNEIMDHFGRGLDQQIRKINSSSILVRFWECFITSMRGNLEDRIQARRIVNIEGPKLYIQWTHCFGKIRRQWYILYQESAPNQATVLEQLEKAGYFIDKMSAYSFDVGRRAVRSSAFVFDLTKMTEVLREDITGTFMFQINEGTLMDEPYDKASQNNLFQNSPATPQQNKILKRDNNEESGENEVLF